MCCVNGAQEPNTHGREALPALHASLLTITWACLIRSSEKSVPSRWALKCRLGLNLICLSCRRALGGGRIQLWPPSVGSLPKPQPTPLTGFALLVNRLIKQAEAPLARPHARRA